MKRQPSDVIKIIDDQRTQDCNHEKENDTYPGSAVELRGKMDACNVGYGTSTSSQKVHATLHSIYELSKVNLNLPHHHRQRLRESSSSFRMAHPLGGSVESCPRVSLPGLRRTRADFTPWSCPRSDCPPVGSADSPCLHWSEPEGVGPALPPPPPLLASAHLQGARRSAPPSPRGPAAPAAPHTPCPYCAAHRPSHLTPWGHLWPLPPCLSANKLAHHKG